MENKRGGCRGPRRRTFLLLIFVLWPMMGSFCFRSCGTVPYRPCSRPARLAASSVTRQAAGRGRDGLSWNAHEMIYLLPV